MKNKIQGNFWKLHVSAVLAGLADIWVPIIFLFYNSINLSLTQIGIVAAIASITTLILEIPSGVFADRHGRKNAVLLSIIFDILFATTLIFVTSFQLVILASLFLGASYAFRSGADRALIYDSFKQIKKEHKFKEFIGKNYGLMLTAGAIALFFSGFIGKTNFRYVFIISAILSIFNLIISLTLQEPRIKTKKETTSIKHLFKSIKEISTNKIIIRLIIYWLIINGLVNGFFKFHQLLAKEIGISTSTIGVIFASMYLVAGIASFNVKRTKKVSLKILLILMPIILGTSYILIGLAHSPTGILFVFLESLIAGACLPIIESTQNKYISSERRATVLSIQSFCKSIMVAGLSIIIGILAESKDLGAAYAVIGSLVIIIGVWSAISVIRAIKKKK